MGVWVDRRPHEESLCSKSREHSSWKRWRRASRLWKIKMRVWWAWTRKGGDKALTVQINSSREPSNCKKKSMNYTRLLAKNMATIVSWRATWHKFSAKRSFCSNAMQNWMKWWKRTALLSKNATKLKPSWRLAGAKFNSLELRRLMENFLGVPQEKCWASAWNPLEVLLTKTKLKRNSKSWGSKILTCEVRLKRWMTCKRNLWRELKTFASNDWRVWKKSRACLCQKMTRQETNISTPRLTLKGIKYDNLQTRWFLFRIRKRLRLKFKSWLPRANLTKTWSVWFMARISNSSTTKKGTINSWRALWRAWIRCCIGSAPKVCEAPKRWTSLWKISIRRVLRQSSSKQWLSSIKKRFKVWITIWMTL